VKAKQMTNSSIELLKPKFTTKATIIGNTMLSAAAARGFFGIGILNGKTIENVGTLWRSADLMGAKFIYTIGRRYRKQASDTMKSWRNIPLYNYETFEEFYKALPYDCQLIGIELHEKSEYIQSFIHPERCVYLLGAEDSGLSKEAIEKCHKLIQLPGRLSMNVAVAGSIVMYDRINKLSQQYR
jgi:tRNA (guanosine-2'-O-)-methyltransferase